MKHIAKFPQLSVFSQHKRSKANLSLLEQEEVCLYYSLNQQVLPANKIRDGQNEKLFGFLGLFTRVC